jgi:hypothetical protein
MRQFLFAMFLIAGIGCSGSGTETPDAHNLDIYDVSVTQEVFEEVLDNGLVSDIVDVGSEDIVGCEHLHYFGDGLYGDNCWEPPENLCKGGDALLTSWYCKPDGSLCCLTPSSRCFYCGWVECGPEMNNLSDECQDIDIPERYLDCAADPGSCAMNSPDVHAEMNEGECEFSIDAEYQVCWDDYVDGQQE